MLKDLVKKDRSCRGYHSDRRVSREELLDFIDDARYCPSGGNLQVLKFAPVWEPETVKAVLDNTRWGAALPELKLPREGKEPTAFIVICQDTSLNANPTRFLIDVGIAAQTMLLAATEKGLGGCMIGNFNKKGICEALQLPEHLVPLLVTAYGEPDETQVITEVGPDGSTAYYRDSQDIHYVPKRSLKDLVIR